MGNPRDEVLQQYSPQRFAWGLECPENGRTGRSQLKAVGDEIKYVKSDRVLMIVTNSDHILNGLRIAVAEGRLNHEDVAIYFFNDKNDVERIYLDRGGRCDHWPPGFFDAWQNALEKLIDLQCRAYEKKNPPKFLA